MQLEADAREALPYSIESCTKPLGPLRQNVFACLTCNPPPTNSKDNFRPAGVCYACSVQCHGDHQLVEIFSKRNFTCDCGTTRLPTASPCSLRLNSKTNSKGGVHSEQPDSNNKYNQNFQNRFCSCKCDYDPFQQKGTMYQCLGLGTADTGGCGEDWYHPGCLVGLGPIWFENMNEKRVRPVDRALSAIKEESNAPASDVKNSTDAEADMEDDNDVPPPPGFPDEEAFESFICYKCVDAHPWIKQYAGTAGFLPPVYLESKARSKKFSDKHEQPPGVDASKTTEAFAAKKRKLEKDSEELPGEAKRAKTEEPDPGVNIQEDLKSTSMPCKLLSLPPAPTGSFSLFFTSSFREHLCHCAECFPKLKLHEQLLEEEETYEPPLSSPSEGGSTAGSGSIYDRGESALKNVDRVRAIEGVMAYNHLKDKLKPFFQQFAESGQAISAEDIKEYFAKLRGDDHDRNTTDDGEDGQDGLGDNRREQSGY